jgi:hypothetical protein
MAPAPLSKERLGCAVAYPYQGFRDGVAVRDVRPPPRRPHITHPDSPSPTLHPDKIPATCPS